MKVSASLSPERLARAKQLMGSANSSAVLDLALDALIERELERRHEQGYRDQPQGADAIHAVDPVVWTELPWEDGDHLDSRG